MDLERAKAIVDEMEANEERFEREMGGREMIRWIAQELQRRRELRESQRDAAAIATSEPPPAAPTGSLRGHPAATLIRRVEVLETQLRHLTRRLEEQRLI
jgi:hypothetical protein